MEAPWEAKPLLWELLWALASRARRGQAVDRFGLSNSDSERAIVDPRSRLGRLLPAGLNARIEVAGRRSYRLGLGAGTAEQTEDTSVRDELLTGPKTKTELRTNLGWGAERVNRVCNRLLKTGRAIPTRKIVASGHGAKKEHDAIGLPEQRPSGQADGRSGLPDGRSGDNA